MSIFLILYITSMLGYRILTHVLLIRFVQTKKNPNPPLALPYPSLSILVPIKGPVLDWQGLKSLLVQEYPGPIELVIGIRDENDTAVLASKKLVADTPSRVQVKWAVGGTPSGYNPKNANLDQAFQQTSHDWIYCSDVDTRPDPTHLKEMIEMANLDPKIFVTSISIHERPKNLGACLEVFGTNLEATGFFLFASLSPRFGVVNGASNLFHRHLLQSVGGFAAVTNSLTDDLLFGRLFVKAGAEGRLAKRFCRVDQPKQSLRGFKDRYVRWLMITKYFRGDIFWPAPLNWVGQWLLAYGLIFGSAIHWKVGAGLLFLRMLETVFVEVLTKAPKQDWFKSWTILFYDLIMPYLWVAAVLRKKVVWGGNTLQVRIGGKLEKVS